MFLREFVLFEKSKTRIVSLSQVHTFVALQRVPVPLKNGISQLIRPYSPNERFGTAASDYLSAFPSKEGTTDLEDLDLPEKAIIWP